MWTQGTRACGQSSEVVKKRLGVRGGERGWGLGGKDTVQAGSQGAEARTDVMIYLFFRGGFKCCDVWRGNRFVERRCAVEKKKEHWNVDVVLVCCVILCVGLAQYLAISDVIPWY